MNGKDLAKLKQLCEENRTSLDIIMQALHLAGSDDRVLDYLTDNLWSAKQRILGLDVSDHYPTSKKEG